jgi:hypothetical protein
MADKIRISILSIFIFSLSWAQSNEKYPEHASAFIVSSLTYNFSENWMAYLELQGRSIERFTPFDYYEIKGGLGYTFIPKNQIFLGIGRYGTYKEEKFSQEELRVWLQYTYSFNLGKIKSDNRFRAEKRFFHNTVTNQKSNDERYRLRTSATLPINKDKVTENTFFLNVFEEIFLGPKTHIFKRNRLFAGFGYQFTRGIGTNLGYIWQHENYVGTPRNLHFIYLGLNFKIGTNKKQEIKILPVAD